MNTPTPPEPEAGPRLLPVTSRSPVIEVQLNGLEGETSHVSLHFTVQIDPADPDGRLGMWSAVRGDGRARVGWFTARRMGLANVFAAGLQGALELAEGPDITVLADDARAVESLPWIKAGTYTKNPEECGYYHVLPEILDEAREFLATAPPFTLEIGAYSDPEDFPPHLVPFYAALHLGSTVLRLLRDDIPMDDQTQEYLAGLPLSEPVSKLEIRRHARRYACARQGVPYTFYPPERLKKKTPKPLKIPGGDWECLPVGAALMPTPEGVWWWAAVDAGGNIRQGSVHAEDRARAAEAVADEAEVGPSCVNVIVPRQKGRKTGGRRVLYRHNGQDAPDAKLADATAHDLAVQAQSKVLPYSGPFMAPAVDGWSEPPPAIEADPYLLAVDAAWDPRHGIGVWACVTGGGWYASAHETVANIQEAELLAIARGLDLFPPGCELTVLTDNTQAEWAAKALLGGETPKQIAVYRPWLNTPRGLLMLLRLSLAFQEMRSVEIQWIPRNTHPLHDRADSQAKRQLQIARHRTGQRHARNGS